MHLCSVSVAGLGRKLPDRGLEREIDSTLSRVAEAERRGLPMVKPILSLRKAERERADRVRELSTHTVLLAGSEVPVTHPSMAPLLQAIDAACPDTFLPLKHPVIQLSLFKFCEVVIDEADCENGRSGSTSSVRSSTSGDSSSSSSDGELNEEPQTSQHPQPQLLEERPQEDELPLPLQKPCRNSPSLLAGTQ